MENEQTQQPSIISLIGNEDEIKMEFADGLQRISASIVGDLGREYFEQRAAAFKNIKFADFLNGYTKMRQKQQLNQFGSDFMAGHFGQRHLY